MAKPLLNICVVFLIVGHSVAHPDWLQTFQQLFPTQAPATSAPIRAPQPSQVPQQPQVPQKIYPQQQQQSLPYSYSPGYQQQAVQPAQQSPTYVPQNRAYGQRIVAQPLPQNVRPQPVQQPSQQPVTLSPAYPQQSAQSSASQYSYNNNQVATNQIVGNQAAGNQYQTPFGTDFWFKEGTPVLPCGYGAGTNGIPLPQYNNPRKKCVPNHPMCGWLFSCIQDV